MKIKAACILLIILFVSCQKKITDLEFEKNVMTEILPSLIDSNCIDKGILFKPPPAFGKEVTIRREIIQQKLHKKKNNKCRIGKII